MDADTSSQYTRVTSLMEIAHPKMNFIARVVVPVYNYLYPEPDSLALCIAVPQYLQSAE